MKRVYKARDLLEAQILKDYISGSGIEVFIKGEMLMGAVGELPADTVPEIWVNNKNDYDAAREIVAEYEAGNKSSQLHDSVWKCLECNELIETQFTQCWHCGKYRQTDAPS